MYKSQIYQPDGRIYGKCHLWGSLHMECRIEDRSMTRHIKKKGKKKEYINLEGQISKNDACRQREREKKKTLIQ